MPKEYECLCYLIKRAGMAVSNKEIWKEVWGYPDTSDSRMVDDLVKRLRKKLREAGSEACLETVWGYGYRLIGQERGKTEGGTV